MVLGGTVDGLFVFPAKPHREGPGKDMDVGDIPQPKPDTRGSATGPGPHGALPSGYCCQSDTECRFRNCRDIGGSKMCVDECRTSVSCQGAAHPQQCAGSIPGRCEPVTAGTKCTPSNQFVLGTKKIGDCCTAQGNGTNGLECVGGYCGSFGDITNPYQCHHACDKPSDCPGAWLCRNTGKANICILPLNPNTCKP